MLLLLSLPCAIYALCISLVSKAMAKSCVIHHEALLKSGVLVVVVAAVAQSDKYTNLPHQFVKDPTGEVTRA